MTTDTELLIIDGESEIIIEVDTDVEVLEAAAQGPRGPAGPPGPAGGTSHVRNSAAALSALLVVWEDELGVVRPLDSTDEDHIDLLCGLTITSTSSVGPVTVQRTGAVDDTAWAWTPGRVYLGAGGSLTQIPPNNGFDVLVGVAVSPTRLILDFQDPIEME